MPIAAREHAGRGRAPHMEVPQAINDDWRCYKTSGSVASRNRLVNHYMNRHVRPIATRMRASLPHQVDLDDLVQQGYLGLIDAMDRFDINRDTRFETFSRRRISGAIQDYLRSIDPVPRLTRMRNKRVTAVVEGFHKRHGRGPDEDELRSQLNLPEPDFQRFLADRHTAAMVPFSSVHPDGPAEEDGDGDAMHAFEDYRHPSPAAAAQKHDLQRWLTAGFDTRDRLIVVLYYYEEMTMREIGKALGISESRVSQRLESILACLRSRLTATGSEREFNV
jgi:RNA polymerase sigma factor for flagellar operon FliA